MPLTWKTPWSTASLSTPERAPSRPRPGTACVKALRLDWFNGGLVRHAAGRGTPVCGSWPYAVPPGAGQVPFLLGERGRPRRHGGERLRQCAASRIVRSSTTRDRAAMLHRRARRQAVSPVRCFRRRAGRAVPQTSRNGGRRRCHIITGCEVALRVSEALGTGHAAEFPRHRHRGRGGARRRPRRSRWPCRRTSCIMRWASAATQARACGSSWTTMRTSLESLHPAMAVRGGLTAAYAAQGGYCPARAPSLRAGAACTPCWPATVRRDGAGWRARHAGAGSTPPPSRPGLACRAQLFAAGRGACTAGSARRGRAGHRFGRAW